MDAPLSLGKRNYYLSCIGDWCNMIDVKIKYILIYVVVMWVGCWVAVWNRSSQMDCAKVRGRRRL